jgi:small GTP-binding protein
MPATWDYLFRIIIIGESSVGKSCLLGRYFDDEFSSSYVATIGLDFKFKSIVVDEKRVKLQCFDCAGACRFRSLTKTYYRNVDAAIVVYDVSDRRSFDSIVFWLDELKNHTTKTLVVFIVGNKIDLVKHVETEELKVLADIHHCKWFETSAKENSSVEQMFEELIADIGKNVIKKYLPLPLMTPLLISENIAPRNKCCN